IKIEGKTLPAGKYGLFTVPGKDSWEIVFNKTWKQWGAYQYKQADDVLRVTVKPVAADMTETLKIDGDSNGAAIKWEKLSVPFKISQ
ncbi:MAG: DUF2911 domain-containing protein, partial [Chitinophagaceae bacterium]|nr:DUF2911 domain-containing protein [Chitinophagaceae bacterium]